MSKFLNLIWRVPVAIIGGGIGYAIIKVGAVAVLAMCSQYMNATTITLVGTFIPLAVPATFAIVFAFGEFIFPPKPPAVPPGGYIPQ